MKTKSTIFMIIIYSLFLFCHWNVLGEVNSIIKPVKVETAPVIDGNINDAVWEETPGLKKDFITFWPAFGDPMPQKTHVWAAYDKDNLYFAFHCFDTEPNQIKTSVCSRDRMWDDDWVGLGLDSIGNMQRLHGLAVNPDGIQGDSLFVASGMEPDQSVDWVWYSGAQRTDNGYTVEIKIPLRSLRFQSGKNISMRVIFMRQIPRYNLEGSFPPIPIGQSRISSSGEIVYDELSSKRKREIIPSVTSSSIWDREEPTIWSSAKTRNDLGFSAKYGITSSITAELTVNPDFSQVESDAFQIQVNQRYPLFYTEKRPFFMETGNMFNLAGTGDESNLISTMHTRRIIDPRWGAKLTGEVGKTSFGFLTAGDEWIEQNPEDPSESMAVRDTYYIVGRFKRTIKGDNYFGALYSGREWGDNYNRVIGGDFHFRFKKHHSLDANVLFSMTNRSGGQGHRNGNAMHLRWNYNTKPLETMFFLEHFDKDFNLETGFYRRTGITSLYYYFCPLFYPNAEGFPWIRRLRVFTFGFVTHDYNTGMKDYFTQLVLNPFMSWNGWLRADINLHAESWGGVQYKKPFFRFWGSTQFTKWLNVFTLFRIGKSIYYHPIDHFRGNYINWRSEMTLQPTGNFNQSFSHIYERLENPYTQKSQYRVHILQSRTTYQFNKYFFIRALVKYDSYRKVVLTDLLASFTLIPGTVMHLGYGSLHQNLRWENNEFLPHDTYGKYYHTSRSFFFKTSYRFRF